MKSFAAALAFYLYVAALSPVFADDTILVANPDWTPGSANTADTPDSADTPDFAGKAGEDPDEPANVNTPMSLDGIPQASETIVSWGVVSLDCPVFSKEGKRFSDKAGGGTLVEIEKFTRTSKREEMAFGHLWNGNRWFGPFLVPAQSLIMFTGTRANVSANDLANLVEYCRLGAAKKRREATLERAAVDANPYAARLRELAEENKTMARRTKELTERRDNATGPMRNTLADELRKLQIAAAAVARTLNEQIRLYENWKAAHPVAAASTADDPEWHDLDDRQRALAPLLKTFNLSGLPRGEP